ncbi:MAG: YcaO-like family protein, partial [Pseudomonadota bacterium]
MEITVNFLDNLRLEAKFDDFTVVADQPIRYKGDGSAPSPFDYFLASSALCAAYFIRVYCLARDLPTDDIRVSQNNIVDPENRYNQIFQIDVALPDTLSEKDRQGILRAVDRCTVKKVVQAAPDFRIEATDPHVANAQALLVAQVDDGIRTCIPGKDAALEDTIVRMTDTLAALGMKIEVSSWRNIVPNVWSLNIRDAASPMCFTNGKGATRDSALCSALGEFIERLSCNFFYNDQYFGPELAGADFVHYPEERWFPREADDALPSGILDAHCRAVFDPDGELRSAHLLDTNSGRADRGICCSPYRRHSDGETVYVPSNLI